MNNETKRLDYNHTTTQRRNNTNITLYRTNSNNARAYSQHAHRFTNSRVIFIAEKLPVLM